MRLLFAATAMLASTFATMPAASAAPVAGAQYAGVMSTSVDSKSAYVGQPVTLTNVRSQSGDVSGATMTGTVTKVVHAGQGRAGELQMTFTRLRLASGAVYAIDGVVSGMQTSTKSNAMKEVGGAVAGMLVGNMLLKTVFHASGGGLLGAAGGYLIARNNRQDVTVPSGSAVRVTLRSVRRQIG